MIILPHNYQTPDIFHKVADIVGGLALAREAPRGHRRSEVAERGATRRRAYDGVGLGGAG